MIKFYEFYGLCRSGNHAIVNWIINNLISDTSNKIFLSDYSFYCDGVFFQNNYNGPNSGIELFKKGLRFKPTIVLISYEEADIEEIESPVSLIKQQSKKFTIVRSLKNLLASRLKNNMPYKSENINSLSTDPFFLAWEKHVRYENNIFYDKWLIDKAYRDMISLKLGIYNRDLTDDLTTNGGGSSFSDMILDTAENLLTRYRQYQIPDKMLEKSKYYTDRNREFAELQQ